MKKIFCLFLGIAILSLPSCFKLDNWDEPDCTFYGTIFDSYTEKPLLASQNDWQIRIWERSWTGQEGGATTQQDLRIKQDGTFQNTKLFAGTYDMLPYDGPFWQVIDTAKNVVLKGKVEQNFTVTPYLVIDGFTYQQVEMPANRGGGPGIWVKFRVKAPALTFQVGSETRTIPNLREIRLFISHTDFCGNGSNSSIGDTEYTDNGKGRLDVNQSWANILDNTWKYAQSEAMGGLKADENPPIANQNTSPEFDFLVRVKKGYTYSVRVGASTATGGNRWNYSPIQKITIQ